MMNFWEDLEEDFKKKIYWGVVFVFSLIAILSFYASHRYGVNNKQQSFTVEKVTGKYDLVEIKGPSPLVISVRDTNTNVLYPSSFVSSDCPQYGQKAQAGTTITLVRFTNVNIYDKSKSYFFKGAYEQICTNLQFNPESGDNFLKPM